MGLFRRSRVDVAEFESVKNDLESLREQLDDHRAHRDELSQRVESIDEVSTILTQKVAPVAEFADDLSSLDKRLDEVDKVLEPLVERMRQVPELADELDEIRRRVESLGERETEQVERAELAAVVERLDEIERRGPARSADDAQRLAELAKRLDQLDQRVGARSADFTKQLANVVRRLDEIEQLVSVRSRDFAEQLAALNERLAALEAAAQAAAEAKPETPAPAIDPAVLDELAAAQRRLANEQARYQIAFRDDLAQLAEQIRQAAR